MDNVFTPVLKKSKEGEWVYDWTDFDRRVEFIHRIGADPIMAVSYMPQALDAVAASGRTALFPVGHFVAGRKGLGMQHDQPLL